MTRQLLCVLFFAMLMSGVSVADEIRPGYLELRETDTNLYSVVWKVPAKGDRKLRLEARLPTGCREISPPSAQLINGAHIQRWMASCDEPLVGRKISIDGLQYTSTDVLLRMEFLDGISQSARLTPSDISYKVPQQPSSLQVAFTYLWLGVEHILLGIDHLLFVFALLLIVNGLRRLFWTITAFTLAHSVTLVAATLGYVQVPQQPVEAIIALSILFLATEIVRGRLWRAESNSVHIPQAHAGATGAAMGGSAGLTERWPWIVAFSFGLLHGFGFAGALAEVGLPQQAIPLALVFFNVGVELGQLAFVCIVLLLGWLMRRIRVLPLQSLKMVTTYAIGSVAAFWSIERVAGFWS